MENVMREKTTRKKFFAMNFDKFLGDNATSRTSY